MQPDFEKANEIYFRLGIIYKQQQKFNLSLEVRDQFILRVCDRANVRSASNISSTILLALLARKTSGSRLATSTNSRKM